MYVRRLVTLCICFFAAATLFAPSIFAQGPASIHNFSIQNGDGDDVTSGPLLAGQTYTMQFTIEIPTTLSDRLRLVTGLEPDPQQQNIWHVSDPCPAISPDEFTPRKSDTSIDAEASSCEYTVHGIVPAGMTTQESEAGRMLHEARDIELVRLALMSNGQITDTQNIEVIDEAIRSFRRSVQRVEQALESAPDNVLPEYKALVSARADHAKLLGSEGRVVQGQELADAVPADVGLWPAQSEGDPLKLISMGAAAGFLLIAAVLGLLWLRTQHNLGTKVNRARDALNNIDELLETYSNLDSRAVRTRVEQIRDGMEGVVRR